MPVFRFTQVNAFSADRLGGNPLAVVHAAGGLSVAAQGTALQRAGRVHLRRDGEDVWVGGHVMEVIGGEVTL